MLLRPGLAPGALPLPILAIVRAPAMPLRPAQAALQAVVRLRSANLRLVQALCLLVDPLDLAVVARLAPAVAVPLELVPGVVNSQLN